MNTLVNGFLWMAAQCTSVIRCVSVNIKIIYVHVSVIYSRTSCRYSSEQEWSDVRFELRRLTDSIVKSSSHYKSQSQTHWAQTHGLRFSIHCMKSSLLMCQKYLLLNIKDRVLHRATFLFSRKLFKLSSVRLIRLVWWNYVHSLHTRCLG